MAWLPAPAAGGQEQVIVLELVPYGLHVLRTPPYMTTAQITWPARYIAKARLSVWLASRPDPRHRLREAISAGLFPMSHDAFEPIRAFLTQLAAAAAS